MKRVLVVTFVVLTLCRVAHGDGFEDLTVEEAVRQLELLGLRVIYSTDLVKPDMLVAKEPVSSDPEEILSEILAPHGLEARPGPGGNLVIVRSTRTASIVGRVIDASSGTPIPGVEIVLERTDITTSTSADGSYAIERLEPGAYVVEARAFGLTQRSSPVVLGNRERATVNISLLETPFDLGEVVVTSSNYSLYGDGPATRQTLSKAAIDHLPHLGDDVFRAAERLPGIATTDLRAALNIRGGGEDEILILLDGLEILSPFHLDEFQRAFGVIDSESVGGIEMMTGGFPAEFGGRMSGVMDITFDDQTEGSRFFVGTSFINSRIGGEGTYAGGKGAWLASYRRGYLDVILNYIDNDSQFKPSYGDLLLRTQYQFSGRTILSANALVVSDDLDSAEDDERVIAAADDWSFWSNVKTAWSPTLYSQTVLSVGGYERVRIGDIENAYHVDDFRDFQVAGLKQDWIWDANGMHSIRGGFDFTKQRGSYDYQSVRTEYPLFNPGPITRRIDLDVEFEGTTTGLYLSDRIRLTEALIVDAGLRFDDQTWIDDDPQLSPRLAGAYQLDEKTIVRASWGRFFQHQRLNELQVEDGVDELQPAQLSEQWIVGIERTLTPGLLVRAEGYQKDLSRLSPRWENLFRPYELFPEATSDRYLVDADRGVVRGLELFTKWDSGGAISGFVSYTYSRAEDIVDGEPVPRRWDQPHAVNANLYFRRGAWNLGVSGTYHTGWPTTSVSGTWETAPDGTIIVHPEIGPVNAERYPDYLRIDFRASRAVDIRHGDLSFYLELINVTDRANRCCVDYFDYILDENGQAVFKPVYNDWLPILPSFGVMWSWP